ncbi:diguanylate cyclase domain-containing protein [Bacterioplanoides sp.]|uniref:diguanylate cyclase domain-containing protein n=1 Tax=Bacterioplanoides sp. TaxID=2066072 RepID=UPI003AFF9B9A
MFHSKSKKSRLPVLYGLLTIMTLLGLVTSLILAWSWNMQSLKHEFDSESYVISQYVREKMAQNETLLVGLFTYFKGKDSVDLNSVRNYASIMARRFPHVHMFQVAQFVEDENWQEYEHYMQQQLIDPAVLRFVSGEGLVPQRIINDDQALPVIMIEPAIEASRLGLDLKTIDFINDHIPQDISEKIVPTEPFQLLDDEPVMVMMQIVVHQSVPQFLSLLVVKVSDLLPSIADQWHLGVELFAVTEQNRFRLVGKQSDVVHDGLLRFFPVLHTTREISLSDYTLEVQFSRPLTWADIKWSWLVIVVMGIIVFPTLYRQMFHIHSRFEAGEEEKRRQLYQQANYDGLTGLPNRYSFDEYAQRLLSTAERSKADMAVFYLDLDGFKAINDQLGHDTGDYVLEQVGKGLASALRRGDMAARLGGDEFIVLVDPIETMDQLLMIQKRLQRVVEDINGPRLAPLSISASIGYAYTSDHGYDLSELMKTADTEMYRQKRRHHEVTGSFVTNTGV